MCKMGCNWLLETDLEKQHMLCCYCINDGCYGCGGGCDWDNCGL